MRTLSTNRLVNDTLCCFASGVIFTVVVVAKVVVLIGLITLAAQAYEGPDIVVTGENISTHAPFIAVTNHVEKGMVHFRVVVSSHTDKHPQDFVGWLAIREGEAVTPRDEQHPIAFAAITSLDVDGG